MQDFARLPAGGMASILAYLAMETEPPIESLDELCETLKGWEPHYMSVRAHSQSLQIIYARYKDGTETWNSVANAAWALAQRFQGLASLDSPLCQAPQANGRACGKIASADGRCKDPSNHATAAP